MSDPAAILDHAPEEDARRSLERCCGATRWVERMLARRPFGSPEALYSAADAVWAALSPADHVEAFGHHPRIGDDVTRPGAQLAPTAGWSAEEQSGVAGVSDHVLRALRDANVAYERRFGFVFIVCATGLSARAMLARLEQRMANTREAELRIAAGEQALITRLRLEKLAP